ncbi:RHS repeat-associated core domain-containing protein [Lentisphaerota bacterium WC36G]|nr:RHS repeat-associated core domain-containing protein [Lentisphaerae bacterium WC36]
MALEKDGVVFNYIADGNKNITQLIDMSSGSVANRYDYSPFGQLSLDNETVANPFKFSSEYAEKETGLVYYNYRYYNPSTGKWLSRDPIEEKGGINVYGFVNNQPISNTDHLGKHALSVGGIFDGISMAIVLSMKNCPDNCPDACYSCCENRYNAAMIASLVAFAAELVSCTQLIPIPIVGAALYTTCVAVVTAKGIMAAVAINDAYGACRESCSKEN